MKTKAILSLSLLFVWARDEELLARQTVKIDISALHLHYTLRSRRIDISPAEACCDGHVI
jgi:hypothetical protein